MTWLQNIRWRPSRTIRFWFVILFVSGTFIGNLPGFIPLFKLAVDGWRERLNGKPTCGISETIDILRRDVRDAIGKTETPGVAYLYLPDGKFTSYRRSLFLALNWEMMPGRVAYGNVEGIGSADIIVKPSSAIIPQNFTNVYRLFRQSGDWEIWTTKTKTEASGTNARKNCQDISAWRELAGLSPILLLFLLSLFRSNPDRFALSLFLLSLLVFLPLAVGRCPSAAWVWLGTGIAAMLAFVPFQGNTTQRGRFRTLPFLFLLAGFFALSFLALSHTFPTPNGLGVYGGKAKMLYLLRGIPSGFFTASTYSTLQPVYPPGLTSLTLGTYAVSGICGEWITQLLSVIFFYGLIRLLLARCSYVNAVWIMLLLSIPEALRMTSCFYAEPLLALFFFTGIEWIDQSEAVLIHRFGWILTGACGWIKMEGVLYFFAFWLAVRLVKGRQCADIFDLVSSLLLPTVWYLSVRLLGGYPPDYAMPWCPDLSKAYAALIEIVRLSFATPWRFAFVFPVFTIAYMFQRKNEKIKICGCFLLLCVVGFAAIFSLSRAQEFGWHLRSLERLLWIPSLLTLRMLTRKTGICSETRPCFSKLFRW